MTFLHSFWRGLTMARNLFANLLFLIILIVILFAIFGGRGQPGLPNEFALEINLEGVIVERATPLDPLNRLLGRSVQSETVLGDIEDALQRAATDSRVGAVVLNTTNLQSANLVQIERIATGIQAVKASGKTVAAMGYYFTQPQYLIASYADALYLHPMGEALLSGLASHQTYFAGLLEKLNVDVHIFRVGKFKSAVEPFLRNSMSPEAAEANTELLASLWGSYRRQIAANRGLDEAEIDNYINTLPDALEAANGDIARLAVESRLVDELLTYDGFNARIAQELDTDPDDLQRVDTRRYLAAGGSGLPQSGPGVGLITASGAITGGEAESMSPGIVAPNVVELIQRAKQDEDVRALVVHIDSPGGEALASEVIRQELELVQLAGKPVVVAMGGVAASGGYWISATADKIVASPDTITGSIGIFGVLPNLNRAFENAGVSVDGVGTHPLSGEPSLARPLSTGMNRIIQSSIEQGYHRFITLVARGRDLERTRVEEIAEGRVWSGRQALELGLVDQLGNLEDALGEAAKLAGLDDDYAVHNIEPVLSPQQLLLQQLGADAMAKQLGDVALQTLGLPGEQQLRMLIESRSGHKTLALCDACTLTW